MGGIGGGIIGLFAGAAAPSRVGFAVSFWGLGLLHIATGLVFLSYPATTVVAMLSILIPAVVVEFVLVASTQLGASEPPLPSLPARGGETNRVQ